jgi:hypothetical protein
MVRRRGFATLSSRGSNDGRCLACVVGAARWSTLGSSLLLGPALGRAHVKMRACLPTPSSEHGSDGIARRARQGRRRRKLQAQPTDDSNMARSWCGSIAVSSCMRCIWGGSAPFFHDDMDKLDEPRQAASSRGACALVSSRRARHLSFPPRPPPQSPQSWRTAHLLLPPTGCPLAPCPAFGALQSPCLTCRDRSIGGACEKRAAADHGVRICPCVRDAHGAKIGLRLTAAV